MRNMPQQMSRFTPEQDTKPYRFERFPRTMREAFGHNCMIDMTPDETFIEALFGGLCVFVVPAMLALALWLVL